MSEYIAQAKVKISPDTVGFEKALREKLKPILAKPFAVAITPVTKGFAGAISKSLKDLKAVPVPVVPTNLEAFRAAVAAQSVAIEIPTAINATLLREQLLAAVAVAEAGVVATVPITAGGTGEIAALQTALSGLTVEIQKFNAAQQAASKGSKIKDKIDKEGGKTESARTKITKSLVAAEIALSDVQNASLTVQERLAAGTVAATKSKSAYGAAIDLVAAETTVENNALLNTTRAMQGRIAAETAVVDDLRKRAAGEKALASIITRKNAIEQEATAIMGVEITAIRDLATAQTQAGASSKALTALKGLERRAHEANAVAVTEELAALQANLGRYVDASKRRVKSIQNEIKAEQKAQAERVAAGKTATGQLNFARRGIAATALSLLGIRGATLASTGAFLAGAAAATLFALSVKSAVSLEQELNIFQETANATADQMERVRVTSEALGRDIRLPGISAAEAAQAMTSLAKAGLSVEDSIAGATGVLQLSIAANIDLARSTEIVASALNAFGLAGGEAIHVADVLANSANLAQGSIDDMGIAMQQAAAVGRQAGLSFEDTATFLTILARAGLRGSDAGTSLRTGLIRLINPTEKAQKILDKLGVTIRDAEGNVRPEVFQNLAAATANMTKAQRDQTIAQLAGNDAVRAFSIIMRLTTPELIKFRQENRKAGSAAALTEARAKGLAGQARGLASNLQTVGISIGRSATPALESFVQGLNTAVLATSESDQVARGLRDSLELLSNAWQLTASALGTVAPVALQTASGLANIAHSIGLAEILAGIAAYRVIPALLLGVGSAAGATAGAFAALRTAVITTTAAVAIGGPMSTGLTAIKLGFRAAGAAALTFVTSVQGVAIIAAVAAAGLFYLFTRETSLERAQKELKESTDALSQSMDAYKTAAQGAADATASISTEKLAVTTAALNVQLAESNLRNSDASKRSLERRQLENALAVAIDNQRSAQARFNEALKRQKEAQEAAAVESRNLQRARLEELDALLDLNATIAASVTLRRDSALRSTEELNAEIVKKANVEFEKRIVLLEKENTVSSRDLAKRLGVIQDLQRQWNRLLEPKEMEILLKTDSVENALRRLATFFGIEGKKEIDAWAKAILDGVQPWSVRFSAGVKKTLDDLANVFKVGAKNAVDNWNREMDKRKGVAPPPPPGPAQRLAAGQVIGRVQGLERQRRRARIAGATQTDELAFLEQEEQLLRDRIAAGKLSVAGRAKLEAELERVLNDQKNIDDDIAAAEEQAADDAETAQQKRDAAFLARLGRREQKLLNKQQIAAETEGIADDIRINRTLRKSYQRQINLIKEKVKDKETRNDAIRSLQAKQFQLDLDLTRLLQQQAAQREAAVRESLELDITFFSTTENVRGEINARKRLIALLKRLQADERKGTVEYKRLRNEIAAQQKAIDDLKKQTKERNNKFNELTFTFLQAQQGFAANLLGNLIPIGASGGLVGGTTPKVPGATAQTAVQFGPDQQLLQAQARAVGATPSPPGRDQVSTQILILQTIAAILGRMERGSRHPEARRARVNQGQSYETANHGPNWEN